ncbi:Nudix family hydrolase [Xanthomonas campestris]|uniref:Nudix family hydrolase n=1 Tax=Xanthomonas TaxID=338 RepID=UPI001E4C0B77|nr:Nudix family hydrolase [Xanthomonas campestris]MCC5087744.1 Nudix family hydrolase [Xanthomonas campestris]
MPDSLRSIHVVAGVITDARGRILLTRRTETRDMPGLWEFPGGKREPGETSEQALVRELNEELGIDAHVGAWVMDVPQLYPDKRLRLEVREITGWKGSPRGREGQAMTWVAADKLARYSMPPADVPVVGVLRQPDRYLITPEPQDDAVWLDGVEQALQQGIARIQLRAPAVDPARWHALVHQVMGLRGRQRAQWLLNRDIGLASELGIGVHLGSEQLATLTERPLPADQPVAASCHGLEDLRHAQRLGCDFAVLGPVQATASHPGATPLGWEGFETLREQVSLPIYALGGMQPGDVREARAHGAQGIAAIRGLWPA